VHTHQLQVHNARQHRYRNRYRCRTHLNKRDERCTLRLGVHHHHLRSAHEQSATKRRHREILVLHDTVYRGDHAGKKTLASTRTVERGRRLADCVNEVERRPVKDSIRADDDGEEVACGSINLRASGDALNSLGSVSASGSAISRKLRLFKRRQSSAAVKTAH
jgi:hypothetical protein